MRLVGVTVAVGLLLAAIGACSTAPPQSQGSGSCPGTDHRLETHTADGLPKAGTATVEKAQRVADRQRERILASYGASTVRASQRVGNVWSRTGPSASQITIEEATIGVLEVTLRPDTPCPDGPVSIDAIPVEFSRSGAAGSTGAVGD